MKKSILLYAATFLALSANAAPIGQAQALKLANKFFAQNSVSKRAAAKMAFKVTDQANKVQTENDLLYVINNGNADGYIILAGDNRVAPVLAYADKGHLEESMTTVNPNLQWMLEHYTLEMEWVQTNVKDVPHKAYQQLTSSVQVAEKNQVVKPLLQYDKTTKKLLPQAISWGQNYPFNKYTPHMQVYSRYYGRWYDQETPSGCVATGISTVMRWHQYPNKPKGQSGRYFWQKARKYIESIDFDKDPNNGYSWADMPAGIDGYGRDRATGKDVTERQADNIGRLLRDVGYSIQMNYSPRASGTFLNLCVAPLVNNFGYSNNLRHILRERYTTKEWWEQVTDELTNYGPIVYAGISRGGGHCFVLDGYSNDAINRYVHVDWGWNAMENGWYKLDILEPDTQGTGGGIGAFNKSQQMLRYLAPGNDPGPAPKPGTDDTAADAHDLTVPTQINAQVKKADNQTFAMDMKNTNLHKAYKGEIAAFLFDAKYSLEDQNAAQYCELFAKTNIDIAANSTQNVKFTGNLSAWKASKYRVVLAYPGTNDWTAFLDAGFVTIANTTEPTPDPTPDPEPTPDPQAKGYQLNMAQKANATVTYGNEAKVTYVITNTGDTEYKGKMALCYAYSKYSETFLKTNAISEGDEIIKIPAKSQATVTFYCNNSLYKQLTPGTYYLILGYEKQGVMTTLYSAGTDTRNAGTLTITEKKPEPTPTPSVTNGTVQMSSALFTQNGYSKGRDYATINKSSYYRNFEATYTLKSNEGYEGQVMFYLAKDRASQPIANTIQYANVKIGKNGTVNAKITYNTADLNGYMLYARIAYKNANNRWQSGKYEGTPFFVSQSYYVNNPIASNSRKHPSLGPVGYCDESDLGNYSYTVGVKDEPNNGQVVDGINGIENTTNGVVTLSPTMATQFVNIMLGTEATATIYATTGAAVMNVALNAGVNNVNVSNLAPGMYIVKVAGETLRFVKK